MAAHIADLPAAEIPIHIPHQAIPGKVARIIRMPRRRPDPQVIMQILRRLTRSRQITRFRQLPIAPCVHSRQFADGSIQDHLANAAKILVGMTLGANLRGQFVLILKKSRPSHPCLLDTVAQRLFAVNMQAAIHRPCGDMGVRKVRRTANDRIYVLLLKALTPIEVMFGTGKLLGGYGNAIFVDIAQSHNIFRRNTLIVRPRPAVGAYQGNIELVARRIGPAEGAAGKNNQPCAGR